MLLQQNYFYFLVFTHILLFYVGAITEKNDAMNDFIIISTIIISLISLGIGIGLSI